MSYIKLAIVTDNKDPKGIGRIRYHVLGESASVREKAVKYEEWAENDPFVANPFLPTNMNFIPLEQQTVKIISYDPDNDLLNREYISGPFTTVHDFNTQTNSKQLENTSYGTLVKKSKDIFKNGSYVNKKSKGSLAKLEDHAIYGPYGSDLLFTENGINLRGGKLLSKELTNKNNDVYDFPILSEKRSLLSLKKFSTTKTNKTFKTTENVIPQKKLKYVVEYDVDDVQNPTTISWYVYEVKDVYGDTFSTSVFTSTTSQDLSSQTNIKLINLDGTNTTPTHVQTVNSSIPAYITIRSTIDLLNDGSLNDLDNRLPKDLPHPFYFRPVKTLNDKTFLSKIKPSSNIETINGSGLYFSATENSPKPKPIEKEEQLLVTLSQNMEQSFGTLVSDKVFLLSTSTNETGKKSVPFKSLDPYEYTQEDLLSRIEPNTYATVRGEVLVKLIITMYRVLLSHAHNPGKPMPEGTPNLHELNELIKTLENDLLNKSIRIN